jgi:[ribosomal protein S5]-alanine N-acetyltransferase
VGKLIEPVVMRGMMASVPQPSIVVDDELMLRPWRAEDVTVALRAFAEPDIQHWHFRRLDTESEAAEWIGTLGRDWLEERCATWAIVDRSNAVVVGRVAIYANLEDGYGEVSYWVLPVARRRGVATRACVAATAWAHALGLHRIQLEHSTRNDASRQVALNAGFVEEGVRRGANLHADGWHDMRMYAHLIDDPA